MKFYVVYLNERWGGGHIVDTCDTLLEALELVGGNTRDYTVMIKYDDRRENP